MLLQRFSGGIDGASRHKHLHAGRRKPVICAVKSQQKESPAQSKLNEASKDLKPYMLWDRVMKLQAWWDTRSQADFTGICEILQSKALGKITITKAEDMEGQPLTCLTIVCRPDDGDDVAAALLQWTPATHVTATRSEQSYLPQFVFPIQTAYGTIDVQLSLAGSSIRKVTPNWPQCQAAAETAAAAGELQVQGEESNHPVDAAAVAAAAVEQLHRGLEEGTVKLDAHLLF